MCERAAKRCTINTIFPKQKHNKKPSIYENIQTMSFFIWCNKQLFLYLLSYIMCSINIIYLSLKICLFDERFGVQFLVK